MYKFYSLPRPKIPFLDCDAHKRLSEYSTYIAGADYRCTEHDIRGFTGFIVNDKYNAVDPDAMAICRASGRVIGFIPAAELSDYRLWCDKKPVPCVGYIYRDEATGKLRGRVKAMLPCNADYIQTEFNRYIQWLADTRGPKAVPMDLTICVDDGTDTTPEVPQVPQDDPTRHESASDTDKRTANCSCVGCGLLLLAAAIIFTLII